MPVHHVLVRAIELLAGLWAAGGFVFLSYFGFRWERVRERHFGRADNHAAHASFAHPGTSGSISAEPRGTSVSESPRTAYASDRAQPGRTIRSSSRLQFRYARETGLVSVVIPTYNRAEILPRAIESALGQTYQHLEVIVADDGSTDATPAVARKHSRVRYVRQANAGVSAARNLGMRNARGEYIAFLDSDDAWRPWKIEAQLGAIHRFPDAGLVWTDMMAVHDGDAIVAEKYLRSMYSAYSEFDTETVLPAVGSIGVVAPTAPGEIRSAPLRKGDLAATILLGNLIHTSTALFKRSWCEETGGFDESFARAGEDYEFYIRLCSRGPVLFLDAPSTIYRVGAADQLTAPSMMLEIARNNLRSIQKWTTVTTGAAVHRRVMRRRFADSYAWVGEAELDAGHPLRAARNLSRSLMTLPALDRRAVLLAWCALPTVARDQLRSARQKMRHHAAANDDGSSA